MSLFKTISARLHGLLRREAVIGDIDEEMRLHLQMVVEENVERGMPPAHGDAVRHDAVAEPGGTEQAGALRARDPPVLHDHTDVVARAPAAEARHVVDGALGPVTPVTPGSPSGRLAGRAHVRLGRVGGHHRPSSSSYTRRARRTSAA